MKLSDPADPQPGSEKTESKNLDYELTAASSNQQRGFEEEEDDAEDQASVGQENMQNAVENESKENLLPFPSQPGFQSFPIESPVSKTPSLKRRANSYANEGASDRSCSPPTEKNRKMDLENLRDKVEMLQQQNKVNMQMIQYLFAQVNYLRTQRTLTNEDHIPNTSLAFNPLLHLISSAPGATSGYPESNLPFANYALPPSGNRSLNSFPVSHSVAVQPFAGGHFKEETEKEKSTLKQIDGNASLILEFEKRNGFQESKRSYPALPTAKVDSSMAPSKALQKDIKPFAPPNNGMSLPVTTNFYLDKGIKNQCRTCGKVLSCGSALKLHYRTHTGRKLLCLCI